ncbi:MAG TPA: hypothetical protein VME01_11895 [Solirubrobacteraceae bacterium]|nr:hypothetical protein [Solirubrobacteraceae bacterium]
MNRLSRVVLISLAVAAAAIAIGACGTNHIGVPKSDPTYKADMAAAKLFNQRCGGCHTLSYAGTHGSGANPRTYEAINGPNFNVRCERPAIRVLYAIENGGFSGAYMPQNVVVGQQAREVAMFVAKYAGRQAVTQAGVKPCQSEPIGTLPALTSGSSSSSSGS